MTTKTYHYKLNDPASPNFIADTTERLRKHAEIVEVANCLGISVETFLKALAATR